MDTKTPIVLPFPGREFCRVRHRAVSGFSLTEVSLAIAVIAFAVVVLLALIPGALTTFRQAIDKTVTAQISQRLIGEAQEMDFDFLVNPNRNTAAAKADQFFRLPVRYFDEQGNELPASKSSEAIYHTIVRVSKPGQPDLEKAPPGTSTRSAWFTALPSTSQRYNQRDMTFLTLQIVGNPYDRAIPYQASTLLIDSEKAKESGLTYQGYSAIVARNGFLPPK